MTTELFAKEVAEGLQKNPKHLSSKYFYDDKGSELFQEIMKLPEYYLTRCETEIFSQLKSEIISKIANQGERLSIIELGAGDGTKTSILLQEALDQGIDLRYYPLDISSGALNFLEDMMKKSFPQLPISSIHNTYFNGLEELKAQEGKKLVLFLGSTIGNFTKDHAKKFLLDLSTHLKKGDYLLTGFDLMKDPRVIRAAYDDKAGVTKQFNLNLLRRINKELDADFPVEDFQHYASYTPQSGECKSFLVATKAMKVPIRQSNMTLELDAWESIHTETSCKYHITELPLMAAAGTFETVENFFDCRHFFTDALWKKA